MNEYERNVDFQAVQLLRCGYNCNILLTFLLYSEFSFFILFKDTSLCSLVHFMCQICKIVLTDRSVLELGS